MVDANTLNVKNPTFYIKHHQNGSNFNLIFFMSRYTQIYYMVKTSNEI